MILYAVLERTGVTDGGDYESEELMGVYSSPEKAEQLKERLQAEELAECMEFGYEPFHYIIDEYELDRYRYEKESADE